jgi:hypothetical protein
MQGVCDSEYRFIAVSCMHVGSTNDCEAFDTCGLKQTCASLPGLYHWIGDAADPTVHVMIDHVTASQWVQIDPSCKPFLTNKRE